MDPPAPPPAPRPLVIFVDVDDTLIRTYGSTRMPIGRAVDYVRRMHAEGHTLYCWSRGGADYAREIAESLGLAACFVACLPKPDRVLDDRMEDLLAYCEFVHPNQA